MGLKKYKLGELITQRREKYDGKETLCSWGVSRDGFIRPKQEDADTSIYNVFYRNDFVFNPARMELNSIALNSFCDKAICSSLYEIFYVTREDIVLPEYLNMFIKRDEFARKCWYEAIGSARNYFRVGDLSQFEIALPSIEQQRKYVDVYLALQNNLAAYQSKVEELKLVCDGYIEELRRKTSSMKIPMVRIGDFITKRLEKNCDGIIELEQGINIQKQFITPQRSNSDLYSRRIVRKGDFAYCTQLNNENVAIAYREEEDCVVSSVYDIFYIKDESVLFPLYLMLWFRRSEFGRYVYRLSTGTSYEFLSYEDLSDYKIPLPNLAIQKEIANIYNCYIERQRIAEALKEQLKNICPVLIRGSLT